MQARNFVWTFEIEGDDSAFIWEVFWNLTLFVTLDLSKFVRLLAHTKGQECKGQWVLNWQHQLELEIPANKKRWKKLIESENPKDEKNLDCNA